MTTGSIAGSMALFALPLILGNFFQMLYNTVDFLVVGNFVGREALAAVGATGPIVNILVLFFNGISIGAGVVISRFFGGRKLDDLRRAISTTILVTAVVSVLFTFIGIVSVPFMLMLMSTPDDVFGAASVYLKIYFLGIGGLLFFNMGSGILRAVGDSKRPLLFLIFCSILNIILDLLFVIVFGWGIRGVAIATILAQFISAVLVMGLLITTSDVYRFDWRHPEFSPALLQEILSIGVPIGLQTLITSFSNVVVQGYTNFFGSGVMAAWGCFLKIEQAAFLPMNSFTSAATTFVSQNIGAGKMERVRKGTFAAAMINLVIILVLLVFMYLFPETIMMLFTKDPEVIYYGVYFIRRISIFLTANSVEHVLAGALRGEGDSKGPMLIMLLCYVVFRQLYLYVGTRISNTLDVVSLAFPVGWMTCLVIIGIYYYLATRKYRQYDKIEKENS